MRALYNRDFISEGRVDQEQATVGIKQRVGLSYLTVSWTLDSNMEGLLGLGLNNEFLTSKSALKKEWENKCSIFLQKK